MPRQSERVATGSNDNSDLVPKNIRWEWHNALYDGELVLLIRGEVNDSYVLTQDRISRSTFAEGEDVREAFVQCAVNHFFSAADTMIRAYEQGEQCPQEKMSSVH